MELEHMRQKGSRMILYRVFAAGTAAPQVIKYEDPYKAMRNLSQNASPTILARLEA